MPNLKLHPFHLVQKSPWPLFTALGMFSATINLLRIVWWGGAALQERCLLLLTLFLLAFLWWRDVLREAGYEGQHNLEICQILKMRVALFISSEVLFFVSFFWSFFHTSLNPSLELGEWPPLLISPLDHILLPFLNTLVLLRSGFTLTVSHHALICTDQNVATLALGATIVLGLFFSVLQYSEYYSAPFILHYSGFASIFFISTGFHGLHVLLGTIFLVITLSLLKSYSSSHHLSFEMAAWYWHFVDLVWLFLFSCVYWWGG